MSEAKRPKVDAAAVAATRIVHSEPGVGAIARHGPAGPHVLVRHLMGGVLAVHFAGDVHPGTGMPDFRMDRPHAILNVNAVDESPLWAAVESDVPLAAAFSAAVAAVLDVPWPS
jgi:hypothetical protein